MADPGRSKSAVEGALADGEWLATLYEQHSGGLLRFVSGVLRDRAEADDVLQATFAKAAVHGHDVRPQAIKSWLYRVALREALSRKRRDQIDQKAKQALRIAGRNATAGADAPHDKLVREETIEQVRRAMQTLPAKQLRVVRMRVYEAKTFAQIAAETGLPLGTVLTYMRRALEKLRRRFPDKDTGA